MHPNMATVYVMAECRRICVLSHPNPNEIWKCLFYRISKLPELLGECLRACMYGCVCMYLWTIPVYIFEVHVIALFDMNCSTQKYTESPNGIAVCLFQSMECSSGSNTEPETIRTDTATQVCERNRDGIIQSGQSPIEIHYGIATTLPESCIHNKKIEPFKIGLFLEVPCVSPCGAVTQTHMRMGANEIGGGRR